MTEQRKPQLPLEERMAEWARQQVAAAPPPSDEQVRTLRRLLAKPRPASTTRTA